MPSRAPLATLLLVVLALAGIVSAPHVIYQAAWKVASGIKHLLESPLVARRRVFGIAYADAAERIAREIPRDGDYLLADRSHEPGQPNWIRYDLAPRRARYVGRFTGSMLIVPKEGLPRSRPPFVVIAVDSEHAPDLAESGKFFETARVLDPERADSGIPASIDRPRSGAEVSGDLVVEGWCQEKGSRPCAEIRILIDDDERPPTHIERHPRPDVEAALPEIGSCEQAGYRARFAKQSGEAREHRLSVYFLTADGRHRRLEVETFRWTP